MLFAVYLAVPCSNEAYGCREREGNSRWWWTSMSLIVGVENPMTERRGGRGKNQCASGVWDSSLVGAQRKTWSACEGL